MSGLRRWMRIVGAVNLLLGLGFIPFINVVHGTGFDLYYATRGYVSVPFYIGFAAVHLFAVVTGVALLRRGREASVVRAIVQA